VRALCGSLDPPASTSFGSVSGRHVPMHEPDSSEASTSQVAAMRELAGLWVQSQSVISAYITANVVDAHHVEDLVQEVAQICAEKFASFDRERSFVAWSLGIARHRLMKYYRTRHRDR
jgi:DNA-directed RNA polymerase specialized sigma24 family protein